MWKWTRWLLYIVLLIYSFILLFDFSRSIGVIYSLNNAVASYSAGNISKATFWNNLTLKAKPKYILAYRVFADLSIQEGSVEKAIYYLETAHNIEPENQLVNIELVKAYFLSDESLMAGELIKNFTREDLILLGNKCGLDLQFDCAFRAYDQAVMLSPDERFLLFNKGVFAILANDKKAELYLDLLRQTEPSFEVFGVGEQIHGSNFRWLNMWLYPNRDSDAIDLSPDGIYGGFSHGGQALIVVEIQEKDEYLLQANVLNAPSPPINMAIGVDFHQVKNVSLIEGNHEWETIDSTVTLSPGLHTINIWFNNDSIGEGTKVAAVSWVRLEALTP